MSPLHRHVHGAEGGGGGGGDLVTGRDGRRTRLAAVVKEKGAQHAGQGCEDGHRVDGQDDVEDLASPVPRWVGSPVTVARAAACSAWPSER
jgi:hypothetical protein